MPFKKTFVDLRFLFIYVTHKKGDVGHFFYEVWYLAEYLPMFNELIISSLRAE